MTVKIYFVIQSAMIKKIILSIIILFFLLTTLAWGSYFYIEKKISEPLASDSQEQKEFVIESGQGVKKIAANLKKEGLIVGSDYFEIYVWQKKIAAKLQAGKYDLSSAMTIPEIANLFSGGQIISNEIAVTIPEGFTVKEIEKRLVEKGLVKEGEFLENKLINFSQYGFWEEGMDENNLEGFLFPDTYRFYKETAPQKIIEKMLDNFDKKLSSEIREEIKNRNKTVSEVIILASIVEKEAGREEDMKKVADVFLNRLAVNHPLQSDATVNYVVGEGRRKASYEDLQIDSFYNTYKYNGLPPAPICNPGLNAIKAAIYPEETDYFFFLTPPDRKAIFSKTYAEHLKNQSKYLK